MSGPDAPALDLRHLPPPQPLERALAECDALGDGAVLHLVLVHEPLPLLALLPDRGIAWRVIDAGPRETHVLCWRSGDAAAERRGAKLASGLAGRS